MMNAATQQHKKKHKLDYINGDKEGRKRISERARGRVEEGRRLPVSVIVPECECVRACEWGRAEDYRKPKTNMYAEPICKAREEGFARKKRQARIGNACSIDF